MAFRNLASQISTAKKKMVKNTHFRPVFGHFVLRIQDRKCCAKYVLPNGTNLVCFFSTVEGTSRECKWAIEEAFSKP